MTLALLSALTGNKKFENCLVNLKNMLNTTW